MDRPTIADVRRRITEAAKASHRVRAAAIAAAKTPPAGNEPTPPGGAAKAA